jgi:hypothetical protein
MNTGTLSGIETLIVRGGSRHFQKGVGVFLKFTDPNILIIIKIIIADFSYPV